MIKYTSSFGNIWSLNGHLVEDEVVSLLNKNKYSDDWSVLAGGLALGDLDNIHVVKVTKKVKSKLSNKKISPKSDAYLVCAKVPEQYMIMSNFLLTEDQLRDEGIDFFVVENSGISIKKSDSSRYTICKMSIATFCRYFEGHKYARNIALSLTMYQDINKKSYNKSMLTDFGLTESEHRSFLEFLLNHPVEDIFDSGVISIAARRSNERLRNIIDSDEYVRSVIFSGKHIFDSPYFASYMYSFGKMKNTVFEPYSITNGSGRSKGIYTIIIKPKV